MIHKDVIIVGGGISGLSAAKILSQYDLSVLIIDRHHDLGGQLQKQTHEYPSFNYQRGFEIIHSLIQDLTENHPFEVMLNTTASAIYEDLVLTALNQNTYIKYQAKAYVFATGSTDKHLAFEHNDVPGILPSSVIQAMMHIHGMKPHNQVVVIGSGNTALMTAIYVMEAGVEVIAIVESSEHILGDDINVMKVKRLGIPIYLNYEIDQAIGEQSIEAVKLIHVKDRSEIILDNVHTLCIASGMSPLTQLLNMAGVKMTYKAYLGGFVPILNAYHQTSNPNIFACGDVTGIEDAEIAMYEGYLAGFGVLKHLGFQTPDIDAQIKTYQQKLQLLKEKMHQDQNIDNQNVLKEGPYVL